MVIAFGIWSETEQNKQGEEEKEVLQLTAEAG